MNRTKIILKGAYISVFIALIQGVLTFWRTSVIITSYGTDINSISAAAMQVFSYLILFESGLGAAYLFKMYEPCAKEDFSRVNSLYLGLSESLKKISIKMMIGVILASVFYPLILGDNSVAYFSAILIILLQGIRFVYPYYFTIAKKNLLIVQERQYLINLIDGLINCSVIVVEIFLAKVLGMRIELVLLVGILFSIISNKVYEIVINRKYSRYINNDVKPSYEGDEMTKDILVHQISSLANSHIDTLILSVVDIFSVTIYTSYNSVMTYPVTLVNKIVSNLRASIGLKLSNKDANIYSVFKEIMSLNYFIAAVISSTFILMINKFIVLWIGRKFLLDQISVVLFGAILVHRLVIETIYAVRDGRGLYKESKNYTLLTAISNFILSIILVKPLGIKGLLLATVLSTYIIMDLGNFSLVYKKIFNQGMSLVYRDFILLIATIISSVMTTNFIFDELLNSFELSWRVFIFQSFVSLVISTIFITIALLIFNKSFKQVIKRLLRNSRLG